MLNKFLLLFFLTASLVTLLPVATQAEQLDTYCPQTITVKCSSNSYGSCTLIKTSQSIMNDFGFSSATVNVRQAIQLQFTGTYYVGGGMAACDYSAGNNSVELVTFGKNFTPDMKHGRWYMNVVPVCPSSDSKTAIDNRSCPYHFS